jgi:predicted ABC-type transport system involved in lysophospholipase L1 biosynthesis ATPase subunit
MNGIDSAMRARVMPAADAPLIEVRGVSKDYHSLRPLRVEQLTLSAGDSIALLGFDQMMAQVLVDLLMGTTVPDSGEVRVFGSPTTKIADGQAWLRMLDDFGLLSERAVLVDRLTAEHNLAMPFSLDLDGMSEATRQDVRSLAEEVGLTPAELAQPVGALAANAQLRVRLGRALALRPRVLLAEHPNATLSPDHTLAFAADFSRIIARRGVATLVLTADPAFARASAAEVFTLQPRTGALTRLSGWRRWFS